MNIVKFQDIKATHRNPQPNLFERLFGNVLQVETFSYKVDKFLESDVQQGEYS